MGDRGNIMLKYSRTDDVIYLYTHWRGSNLPKILQEGLRRAVDGGRQGDESYASRIIFATMIGSHEITSTTGFGMSPYMTDNEHHILCVDFEKQQVLILPWERQDRGKVDYRLVNPVASFSFKEYLNLDLDSPEFYKQWTGYEVEAE